MPITSKTGLLPSIKKSVKYDTQKTPNLELPNLVVSAPFTLRPFAGIYNPFPYGCSILCNHPTDFEARAIVQKAKDAWATEGKSLIDLEEHAALKVKHESIVPHQLKPDEVRREENMGNKLISKYEENDFMPQTPAPTLASTATKISQGLRTRRCLTPDPTSFIKTKEKTLLILDLRRSHSQEVLCWQRDDENFDLDAVQSETDSRIDLSCRRGPPQNMRKKTPRKKSVTSSGTASSVKTQNSKDSDSKAPGKSLSKSPLIEKETQSRPTSPESSSSEFKIVKRRGKKRKGKKSEKNKSKEGEKEVKGIPDPGETQVSALETDSKENSSTPSLSREEKSEMINEEPSPLPNIQPNFNYEIDVNSFLNTEILKQLQRQLDQEVVDLEMDIKKRKALEEAMRCKTHPKNAHQGEEIISLKKEFQPTIKNSDKWLSIPRIFTRQCSRFELPMDSRILNQMTPLQYVQNYAYASSERLVLYNHIFNLYKEEPEDEEEVERILIGKKVIQGLGKVMGRAMTDEEVRDFQNLIGWQNDEKLNFRTFVGISSACERLLAPKFCSKMPAQREDPRHQIERADFESLEGKLKRLNPDPKLVHMLRSIRDL